VHHDSNRVHFDRSRRGSARLAVLGAALALLSPARASAFSDPMSFQNDVSQGGGGGRFFTGAPADGYTCSVCHTGAPSADVQVDGLPLHGYTPGVAYEVTIDWADNLDNVALAAELNDGNAQAAGTLRLPPQKELFEPERCVPVEAGLPAGMLIDASPRTILEVPNCGAKRVRFLWIAPQQDVGTVWFAASLVRADGKSDANGDGVTNISTVLPSPSQGMADARKVTAELGLGCTALRAANGTRAPWFAGIASVALLAHRRRARRRHSPS
jgi:hypothetical protein